MSCSRGSIAYCCQFRRFRQDQPSLLGGRSTGNNRADQWLWHRSVSSQREHERGLRNRRDALAISSPGASDVEELAQVLSPAEIVRVQVRPAPRFSDFAVPVVVVRFDVGLGPDDEEELCRTGAARSAAVVRKRVSCAHLAEGHDGDCETHDCGEDLAKEHDHPRRPVLPLRDEPGSVMDAELIRTGCTRTGTPEAVE